MQHEIMIKSEHVIWVITEWVTAMKAREMRLRRAAERQGLRMEKCRRRSADAIGFGRWCLVSKWDDERAVGAAAVGFDLISAPTYSGGIERFASWMSLDSVERLLAQGLR